MTQDYRFEIIAGGVLKDADGNVIDDSSEKAALAKLKELGIPNLMEKE